MQDQPPPENTKDSEPIEDHFRAISEDVHQYQFNKGIAKYGQPLYTFDGRSPADMWQEWSDLGRYMAKTEMERDWYKREYERLRDRYEPDRGNSA